MKCYFCRAPSAVVVGGCVLEQSDLFYDVVECLRCGSIGLYAPSQVVIGRLHSFAGPLHRERVLEEMIAIAEQVSVGESGVGE